MKKLIVLAALASPLILAGCSDHHYNNYYPAPPGAVDNIAQRGYHDGFEAARHDVNSQRSPDMRRHGDFRNPPVPGRFADDYRRAFRSGYESFLHNGRDRDDRWRDTRDYYPPYR
jgi:hypothetical protein